MARGVKQPKGSMHVDLLFAEARFSLSTCMANIRNGNHERNDGEQHGLQYGGDTDYYYCLLLLLLNEYY